jgi:hypothetical protein
MQWSSQGGDEIARCRVGFYNLVGSCGLPPGEGEQMEVGKRSPR